MVMDTVIVRRVDLHFDAIRSERASRGVSGASGAPRLKSSKHSCYDFVKGVLDASIRLTARDNAKCIER